MTTKNELQKQLEAVDARTIDHESYQMRLLREKLKPWLEDPERSVGSLRKAVEKLLEDHSRLVKLRDDLAEECARMMETGAELVELNKRHEEYIQRLEAERVTRNAECDSLRLHLADRR